MKRACKIFAPKGMIKVHARSYVAIENEYI